MHKKLAKINPFPYSIIMDKKAELKEIIRIHTPLADEGNVQAMQLVINAQIELDEILEAEQNQLKLNLTQ